MKNEDNYTIGDMAQEPSAAYGYFRAAEGEIHVRALEDFEKKFGVGLDFFALVFGVTETTIYRWFKADKYMEKREKVIYLEMLDLFRRGRKVMGSEKVFVEWLYTPHQGLGGVKPVELLEYTGGFIQVRNLLGRVAHGIIS